jgi:hypothetical protein
MGDLGILVLFSIGVLTMQVQNRADKLLLSWGDLSAGRLMEIRQVMATGRSRINLIQ